MESSVRALARCW